NAFDVVPLAYTKVLLLLDGETHTPGVAPGKTNSASPPQAGDTVNATVYAVDDYWNLVDTVTPTIEMFTSDYSVIPSSSQVLVDGEGFFQIIYRTAGIQITTAYDKAIPIILDTSSIFINPAEYVGLQIIAPGEAADPGSTTGKTSALPGNQTANQSFTVKVMAVDQYWNRVTNLNGKQIRLTSGDGSLDTIAPYTNPANQNSPFVAGEMDFEIYLASVAVVTLDASDFTDMTKTSGTVDINVLAGYEYEIVITSPPPFIAGPPSTFAMTIKLVDGGGIPVPGANNGITLSPCLTDYTPAGGTLGVTTAALNNGTVSISEQSYNLAETIRIKVTDDYGREKYSAPIVMEALGLYYDVTVPDEATVGPPEQFSMVIELKDSSTGQIVTTWDRQVNIEIRSADNGAIGTGALGVANDYLNSGVVNVTQSYTKAENVYFIISDTHTLQGTSKIFRIKPDGYKKLQIVAPGETPNPGNSSATGKLGALAAQQAGLSFTVSVRAVDQYWNLAESFNGDHIRLASSDGSLDDTNPFNQGDLFVNGRTSFVITLNNNGDIDVTCSDEDNPSKPIQTVTIPVSYATYQFVTPVNAPSGPPDEFAMTVNLIDGNTMAPLIANHVFNMEAVTTDYQPTTGVLGVTEAVLDNGSVVINSQSYNLVEDIRIKITDGFGRVAYSDIINVIATFKKYEVFVPAQAMVGPPNTFDLTIELHDTETGNLITTQDHSLNIEAYSSVNGLLATGNLGVVTATLQGGRITIAQTYDNIENIFFKIWDPASLVADTFSTDIAITAGLGTVLSLNVSSLTVEPEGIIPIIATLEDEHSNKILNARVDFRIMQGEAVLNADFDLTNNLGEATVSVTCNKDARDGEIVILVFTDQVSREFSIQIHGVPETTMSFTGVCSELRETIHLKSDTPIILSATSQIGVDRIYYRIDGGEWQEYTGEFFIPEIGIYTLEYYAVDQNGHQETMKVSKSIYISVSFLNINKAINYPNPFRAGKEPTLIEYNLYQPSSVTITIYDLLGQVVWKKSFREGENGGDLINSIAWWGRNGLEEVIGNGGYICRIYIQKERKEIIRKIAVVK
ncbi:T9SS type A sorting domain-containing protein, partial [bacterium]|nr:T9SS type A sorting domain-containing protein [bacterium]